VISIIVRSPNSIIPSSLDADSRLMMASLCDDGLNLPLDLLVDDPDSIDQRPRERVEHQKLGLLAFLDQDVCPENAVTKVTKILAGAKAAARLKRPLDAHEQAPAHGLAAARQRPPGLPTDGLLSSTNP
jgi:hypothetical protein